MGLEGTHEHSGGYEQEMQKKFVEIQTRILISSFSICLSALLCFLSWERSTAGNTKPTKQERPGQVSQ